MSEPTGITTDILCILLFFVVVVVVLGANIILDNNKAWDKLPSFIREREKTKHKHLQELEETQLTQQGMLQEVNTITQALTNTRHTLSKRMHNHHITDYKGHKQYRHLRLELLKWQAMLGEEPFK